MHKAVLRPEFEDPPGGREILPARFPARTTAAEQAQHISRRRCEMKWCRPCLLGSQARSCFAVQENFRAFRISLIGCYSKPREVRLSARTDRRSHGGPACLRSQSGAASPGRKPACPKGRGAREQQTPPGCLTTLSEAQARARRSRALSSDLPRRRHNGPGGGQDAFMTAPRARARAAAQQGGPGLRAAKQRLRIVFVFCPPLFVVCPPTKLQKQ